MSVRLSANTDGGQTSPDCFVVAGISLASLRKRLRPALPTKKQEESCRMVIRAKGDRVTFSIAGAAVDVPAVVSRPFVAELPYLEFKPVFRDRHDPGEMVLFGFAPGTFSINTVTLTRPEVIVQAGEDATDGPRSPESPPMIVDPLDACIGMPLLDAYRYIRKYGLQPRVASKTFAAQQAKVDQLLRDAGFMLREVGITRTDLEHILDRKLGIG